MSGLPIRHRLSRRRFMNERNQGLPDSLLRSVERIHTMVSRREPASMQADEIDVLLGLRVRVVELLDTIDEAMTAIELLEPADTGPLDEQDIGAELDDFDKDDEAFGNDAPGESFGSQTIEFKIDERLNVKYNKPPVNLDDDLLDGGAHWGSR
jgi:hypothetical protein